MSSKQIFISKCYIFLIFIETCYCDHDPLLHPFQNLNLLIFNSIYLVISFVILMVLLSDSFTQNFQLNLSFRITGQTLIYFQLNVLNLGFIIFYLSCRDPLVHLAKFHRISVLQESLNWEMASIFFSKFRYSAPIIKNCPVAKSNYFLFQTTPPHCPHEYYHRLNLIFNFHQKNIITVGLNSFSFQKYDLQLRSSILINRQQKNFS